MKKAILFDLDDTLLKTSESRFTTLKHTGKKFYDMEITDEEIKKLWGLPFTTFMKKLYKEVEAVEKIIANYYLVRENFPNSAFEDVLTTIEKLKGRFRLGIVSATNKKLVHGDMKVAGLNINDFFCIQTEEDTAIHKPNPKVFDKILTRLKKVGVEKHEIIFVGDHLFDFYAAKGAGIDFIGIADRTFSTKELKEKGAKTVKSVSELLKLKILQE
jgi:phosphoglycolate phosphatase